MSVVICLLRGVNVGGHNKCPMQELRALCESLKLDNPQTYVQSGNVVFRTNETNLTRLSERFRNAFEKKFGFRTEVVLRTAAEMKAVVARNPLVKRAAEEPAKVAVMFLAEKPGKGAEAILGKLPRGREELRLDGRELYIYFPEGMGRSKLPWSTLGDKLGTSVTARNWNTVMKLLEMTGGAVEKGEKLTQRTGGNRQHRDRTGEEEPEKNAGGRDSHARARRCISLRRRAASSRMRASISSQTRR